MKKQILTATLLALFVGYSITAHADINDLTSAKTEELICAIPDTTETLRQTATLPSPNFKMEALQYVRQNFTGRIYKVVDKGAYLTVRTLLDDHRTDINGRIVKIALCKELLFQ